VFLALSYSNLEGMVDIKRSAALLEIESQILLIFIINTIDLSFFLQVLSLNSAINPNGSLFIFL